MAPSLSPHLNPSAYDSGSGDRSPHSDSKAAGGLASLNMGFLRTLTEKRTNRGGGLNGPDSKPALTRRQELNRQAQRTHRERKELYIKALEDEVLRLKEIFSNVAQDKERLADENRRLRTLLTQTQYGRAMVLDDFVSNPTSAGGYTGSSGSVAGSNGAVPSSSHTSAYTPPHHHPNHRHGHARHHSGSVGSGSQARPAPIQQQQQQQQHHSLDYDQAGIDFVLALEKPCMDHLPWLLERSTAAGGAEPCGHALMASCPPEPFPDLTPDIPFRTGAMPPATPRPMAAAAATKAPRTWELSKPDLATLLDLSRRLDLDGEITPVMAWGMVLAHPRVGELAAGDFLRLAEELIGKVRCYGFGAVMEEFEVRDALENVLSTKMEPASVAMAMA
ncbi:hypothetical protein P8C59_005682 [Phyllachora maydis]|uniref:BZIP domain-containing protein n=1 Tax=Phyllachora maydis TaxID=1825666 RepID=A0AAD9I6L6_9PEZI|nr:hypothetical protein P8C59_005682 [Phyllachora maydis]